MEREGFQMNTIAERIKFAMKAKNKKQVDIVKDTGISKGAFSSYLSGQYNPKADKMELIADSLDVDLRWLYGQNVPMEHTSQNDNALQYIFRQYKLNLFFCLPYLADMLLTFIKIIQDLTECGFSAFFRKHQSCAFLHFCIMVFDESSGYLPHKSEETFH